ncbi:hypothetical protein N0V83_004197 [Neocucurbitaria cava]|uniref:Uncharacterized protein n=1 Tax=Neocucurbitaria cava TaxID=798079 RepID=A0A9W8YDQ6_9PLEO|nr:hypothetical protein N0V83_004197 [Neocucurbitaria cava]
MRRVPNPPYTREQLAALQTDEERTVAKAETASYVARLERYKKEQVEYEYLQKLYLQKQAELEEKRLELQKEEPTHETGDSNDASGHPLSAAPPTQTPAAGGHASNRYHPYANATRAHRYRPATDSEPTSAADSSTNTVTNGPARCRLGHPLHASRLRPVRPSPSAGRAPLGSPEENMDAAEDAEATEHVEDNKDTDDWTGEITIKSTQQPDDFTQEPDYVPLKA